MSSVEKLHRSDQLAREMGERDALELKAALETEKQAAEKEKEVSEINVFTLDPHGFKTHWRIGCETTDAQLAELMKRQIALTKWLSEHQYLPDEMGRGHAAPTPVVATPSATPSAPVPGAAVWVMNADGSRACSLHGPANWKAPGVSRTTGKPYSGFWSCQQRGCKPAGDN